MITKDGHMGRFGIRDIENNRNLPESLAWKFCYVWDNFWNWQHWDLTQIFELLNSEWSLFTLQKNFKEIKTWTSHKCAYVHRFNRSFMFDFVHVERLMKFQLPIWIKIVGFCRLIWFKAVLKCSWWALEFELFQIIPPWTRWEVDFGKRCRAEQNPVNRSMKKKDESNKVVLLWYVWVTPPVGVFCLKKKGKS